MRCRAAGEQRGSRTAGCRSADVRRTRRTCCTSASRHGPAGRTPSGGRRSSGGLEDRDRTEDAPWATRRYREPRASLADSLHTGTATGEFRPDIDVDRIARHTIAVMDGLQVQWLLDPSRVDTAADFRAYSSDLVASLRPTT
ncbi:TetR family transcriptional regulator C-terminal domain-containing protein [Streptomyces antarcticus]|uniref:TetR family transcriptional regulator C-terminal domain-containing protein n=1 Tax=Streptomyces antarcticus TaxID=2996458 RepID=UPI00226DCF5C|nr:MULTISPECIES: TetR family transcriptional regulator C-terminal domain-containing protein [unclassified Streptomyces]MCY0942064.1 TetR family transcriptional regulator C-terminal domain-containing protein [Streptomyces sp. H34-AA3]MCZ4081918.1 TetR family transcriptional regulator C-terminal domain-containing protein [Streptomyces sp. H34-S5]